MNVQPLFVYEIEVNPTPTCINQTEVRDRADAIAAWAPPEDDKEAVCELEPIVPVVGQVFQYTYTQAQAQAVVLDVSLFEVVPFLGPIVVTFVLLVFVVFDPCLLFFFCSSAFFLFCGQAFNDCLNSVNTIPQVEHQVMEQLFWSRKPNVKSITAKTRLELNIVVEPGVEHLHTRLNNALGTLTAPLGQYLTCFDQHIEFLNLDVEQ